MIVQVTITLELTVSDPVSDITCGNLAAEYCNATILVTGVDRRNITCFCNVTESATRRLLAFDVELWSEITLIQKFNSSGGESGNY